ncbi:unnamed protein product [Prunus armeniaca]
MIVRFEPAWLGWLGAAMKDLRSLFYMCGEPSVFVWGGALRIQPPFWSSSYWFSYKMLGSSVAIPATLHPSSQHTGLAERDLWVSEEDRRKKNWSN